MPPLQQQQQQQQHSLLLEAQQQQSCQHQHHLWTVQSNTWTGLGQLWVFVAASCRAAQLQGKALIAARSVCGSQLVLIKLTNCNLFVACKPQ
jgi:hypothetical protein